MNKKKYFFAQELVKELSTVPYSKLSISNLCKNLQCSRQSFYYYFDTIDDCLVYYLKETFQLQIREEYLISDTFAFVTKNADFVNKCMADSTAHELFWYNLFDFVNEVFDKLFTANIDEYVVLYIEQKEAFTNFYSAGFLEVLRSYILNKHYPSAEKCVKYCLAIIGTIDDIRSLASRLGKN